VELTAVERPKSAHRCDAPSLRDAAGKTVAALLSALLLLLVLLGSLPWLLRISRWREPHARA
jgi:hypothetical protein